VTLKDGSEKLLHPGKPVDLPSDNRYVRTLVARKLLTEVPAAPREKKTKTTEVTNAS
jgi:hypothetical protein